MYNKVIVVGNLTRDIELRHLSSGTAVARSSIATSHRYKTQSGEQKEEVCFLEFNIFGRIAEVANQYLKKGSRVLLEGRLIFEQWTGNDGAKKSRHSLRVEVMQMLNSKNDMPQGGIQNGQNSQSNSQSSYGGGQGSQNQSYGNNAPTQQATQQTQKQTNNSYNENIPEHDVNSDMKQANNGGNNKPNIDVGDEDIPF